MRRVLKIVGAVLGIAVLGFAVVVVVRQDLDYGATATPDLKASSDPAVIARGEYVVRLLANCTSCHGDPALDAANMAGDKTVPLSGGRTWSIPPGIFRARNITSDPETGIGRFTDGQIARALRY